MRQPETKEFWEAEAQWIASQDPRNPGAKFNQDPACFVRYVEMEAGCAREDGFPEAADRMLAAISKRAIPTVEVPADLSQWHRTPEHGIHRYHAPDGLSCTYHEFTPEPSHTSAGLTVGSPDEQAIFTISVSGGTLDGTAFDPAKVREALWKAAEAIGLVRRQGE